VAILIGERPAQALWRDYLELTKPKVVVLMLITSLVGMFLATAPGCRGRCWCSAIWGLRCVLVARRRSIMWWIGASMR